MKRGLQTSEGKLALLVIVGQLVGALVQVIPPEWSVGGITATTIAYALSRGFTKAGGAEAFHALAEHEPPATHTSSTHALETDAIATRRAQLQAELDALNSP